MVRSLNAHQIPNGWQYELLDKLAERCSGHTPSKSFPEYWNGGIKWISLADSHRLDKGYVYETDKEISTEGIKNSSANVHPAGTVIISRDAGIGKSSVMAEPMAVSQHFIAWKCDNEQKMNNWYLYNWLQFNKQEFERQAVGSTIKIIGLPFFKKLKIAAPPYLEQQKIAKILSTWDKAISTTERLIENSNQQKKALMQQLLTGKKRLLDDEGKRFEGEWDKKSLSNICSKTISYGIVQTGEHVKDGVPCVRVVDLTKNTVSKDDMITTSDEVNQSYSKTILKSGEVMMALRGVVGLVRLVSEELVGSNITRGIARLAPKTELIQPDFFLWILRSSYVKNELMKKVGGSALQEISLTALRKVKIPFPSLKEQQKIATVLTNADKEIELLEQQLADLQQEKKALMQVLLTGKKRVLVDGEVA